MSAFATSAFPSFEKVDASIIHRQNVRWGYQTRLEYLHTLQQLSHGVALDTTSEGPDRLFVRIVTNVEPTELPVTMGTLNKSLSAATEGPVRLNREYNHLSFFGVLLVMLISRKIGNVESKFISVAMRRVVGAAPREQAGGRRTRRTSQ